ncbi:squalene/phytoene synthase family protein [uncultured Paracoccus sp.]|uniref:squalene/phytoene synthase family protein n=1 Tax=uncultured Paracoccus sp. TaxID=189685 RepID=UPI00262D22F3|nr:squalene/phytoene synthase family protein [uncultured Paracoccus sp.]
MTLQACAGTLQAQDPDRFGAVLTAAPADRPKLLTLYALNLELARAPFQSAEPMLAEMRLQWWIDRLAEMGRGVAPPLHDVLTPLWEAWGETAGDLLPLAEARRRDCARDPFANADEVLAYVDATAGGLMWAAAHAIGAPETARAVVADQGRGAGLAAWLRALPQLQSLRLGFETESPDTVAQLAEAGRAALRRAAKGRRAVPRRAAAALFAGPGAARFLREMAQGADQTLAEITPFQRRAALAWLALTGRWWGA